MGEPVNLINISDIDPRQMQRNAREMLRSINLTFIACSYLLVGSLVIFLVIVQQLFGNNVEAYRWAVFDMSIVIAANLFIMMIQVMMVINHYAPTLGLKKDSPFDFGENVVAGKEYDEATISQDKKTYIIFIVIIILIIAVSYVIDHHNINSGFFHRLSLSQLYGGICLVFSYIVHSYLAFTGKYYAMDWQWGRKSKGDGR